MSSACPSHAILVPIHNTLRCVPQYPEIMQILSRLRATKIAGLTYIIKNPIVEIINSDPETGSKFKTPYAWNVASIRGPS